MRPLASLYDTFVVVTMGQAKTPQSIPGRYTLLEEVGQGGMAVVYRAQDETLKREVAVKVLHHHLSAEPESKARLEREAQAVAKLRHENILEIFDYSGSEAESAYIVTEFIDGVTLKQLLATRALGFPEVAALIVAEVGGALAHAHAFGIIHRDIKPENVMIRKDGLLKLMDFGIAQVVDLQRMTVTGQLLGSPAYMAPELIEGKPLDFRTDVFSLGIMLYQLATGSLPFSGKNPHEVLRRIVEGKFPDPRSLNRRVSDALARVMARALARRPDDRYAEVGRMVEDLRELLAEAGLGEGGPGTRAELAAFFADPAAYEAALPARLAAALNSSARRQLEAGRTAKAIELWSRVLAFDPQNAHVAAALRRLERRSRTRTALAAVGVVAVVGLAVMGVGRMRRPRSGASTTTTTTTTTTTSTNTTATATATTSKSTSTDTDTSTDTNTSTDTSTASPPPRRAARRIAAQKPNVPAEPVAEAPPPAPVRTFTLGPTPQNVEVYLDGQKQFAYDTDHTTITVPWSRNHVIEFRSPAGCCFVEKIEVGPDRPLPQDAIIARRLKWRPAHLQVTTEPAVEGARIMVRDPARHGGAGTAARPGDEVDVPFFAEDEASKEIEIAVDTGDGFTSDRVTVRAGQRLSHVVKLKTSN
jgi:eukaryotic-like serine/threonine-protein kinase